MSEYKSDKLSHGLNPGGGILKSFHGTSTQSACKIINNGINVTLGGGELGQGFYTGEHLHEAKQWALHTHMCKQKNVIEFYTDDNDVQSLNIKFLTPCGALSKRRYIRLMGGTRIFHLGCDLAWAPIVGSSRAAGYQYKWESLASQNLLNGNLTNRSIV